MKDPNLPGSGKEIAEGKGVHREAESEGSRRQSLRLMNRNRIKGGSERTRLPEKLKSNTTQNSVM